MRKKCAEPLSIGAISMENGRWLPYLSHSCLITETPRMNKSDLIDAMATQAEVSKAAAGRALDAAISAITAAVAGGDNVTLVGFGTFKSAKRAAREGKNPKTGEKIKIPATTVPKFSAGASFKAAVAPKKKK